VKQLEMAAESAVAGTKFPPELLRHGLSSHSDWQAAGSTKKFTSIDKPTQNFVDNHKFSTPPSHLAITALDCAVVTCKKVQKIQTDFGACQSQQALQSGVFYTVPLQSRWQWQDARRRGSLASANHQSRPQALQVQGGHKA
jgi:hypothetical protein